MVEDQVFTALANPIRRDILARLCSGPANASTIAAGFSLSRPAVSEHLQVLRKAGLIRDEARGRERHYHLDPRPIAELEAWASAFAQYWNSRLCALDDLLAEDHK